MENQTLNPYTQFNPTLWADSLKNKLEKDSITAQCTNQNYEGEIINQGDSVNIISPPNSNNPVNFTINQRKFFAFKVSDIAQAQVNGNIMDAHLQNAKKAIEQSQDEFLLAQHTTADTSNTIGNIVPITLDKNTIYENFVRLALKLKKVDNYATNQKPWVVVNPTIESYLLQSNEFISAYNVADENLRVGAIGRIAGMDVLVSTNLSKENNKTYILAGTNEAITFASQLSKIESLRDKDSFADLIRGLYLYDAKTVQPKSLAKMVVATN